MRLAGKRAVITGGANGLGAAMATRFVREGARVCIADLDLAAAVKLEREIAAQGADVLALSLDVIDPAEWSLLVDELARQWGGIDVLVNNAGIASPLTRLEERSPEEWDQHMAINLRGPFLGIRAVMPLFRAQGGGVVVNMSSVAGTGQSAIVDPAYACSKAGLNMLTRVIAAQHAGEGVRCNAMALGPVDSALARSAYPDEQAVERRLSRVPLGRFAQAREVTDVAVFLASDESAYVNGAVLPVDGGALVQ